MPLAVETILPMVRMVPLALAGLLTILFFRMPGRRSVPFLMLGVTTGYGCYLFSNVLFAHPVSTLLSLPIMLSQPCCLWLLAESLFNDRFRMRALHGWTVFLAVAVATLSIYFPLVPGLPWLIVAAFGLVTLLAAWRGIQFDMINSRRTLRGFILTLSGSNIIVIAMVEGMIAAGLGEMRGWMQLYLCFTSTVNLTMAILTYTAHAADAMPQPKSGPPSPTEDLEEEKRKLAERIRQVMDRGAFLDSALNPESLAKQANMPVYKLRQVVHEQLHYRNFNQLLNAYRIEAAAKRLLAEDHQQDKITAIAFEVGFQSVAPFNRAFREVYGVSPSVYRKHRGVIPPS